MTWSGNEVSRTLELKIDNQEEFEKYLGMAYRHNPKRAHLLVSKVLGKHIPQLPSIISLAATNLTNKIKELDGAGEQNEDLLVFGYAETATNLGALIAEKLSCPYFHSTRYSEESEQSYGNFHEEHSHASAHKIILKDINLINDENKIIVLVDDELTTGKTIMNTIKVFESQTHHKNYIVATLTDMRDRESYQTMEDFEKTHHVRIQVASLLQSHLEIKEGSIQKAEERMSFLKSMDDSVKDEAKKATRFLIKLSSKYPYLYGGVNHKMFQDIEKLSSHIYERLFNQKNEKILVLGDEEDMYCQFKLAELLEKNGVHCEYSTTTLSPIFPHDSDDYAIRNKISYEHCGVEKYCYNILHKKYDSIVFYCKSEKHRGEIESLLKQLERLTNNLYIIEFKGE